MGASLLLAIVLAIPLGLLAGAFKHRWLDHLLNLFAYIGISVPIFWFGILLITVFAVQLSWFPSMGMRTIGMQDNALDVLRHGVLPCIALTFYNLSSYVRYIRSNTISQLSADYVQTQLAYGATRSSILFRHVLKNVLLPVITLFGLSFGELIVGAYVTESVFSWPGMGLLGIQSIASLDYPLIMAIIMLSSMMLIVGNLIADVLYRFADPRIRTLR
nr:ABC transporter permease [Enterobacter asburiae]